MSTVIVVTDADIEALIDEVFAKPGLGVEDSAGIVDYDAETDELIDARMDEDYWRGGAW